MLNEAESKEFLACKSNIAQLKNVISEKDLELTAAHERIAVLMKEAETAVTSKSVAGGNQGHLKTLSQKHDELEIPAVFQTTTFPTPPYPTTPDPVQAAKTVRSKKERFDWQPHVKTIKSIVEEPRSSRRRFETLLNTFPKDGNVNSKFLRAKLLAIGVHIDDATGLLSWDQSKSERFPTWKDNY